MPNPTVIHPRTVKIEHYLKIVDFYIHVGCPEVFNVEPCYKSYEPDVYMKDRKGNAICVEVQITPISMKRMQKKVDEFVTSFKNKEHDSTVMLLVTNQEYNKITIPPNFSIVRLPLPKEPYA